MLNTRTDHHSLPTITWMMPEKPWSRIHIDHAINFMGSNWLVTDAYSKYPCITRPVLHLPKQPNFAHFGYPHNRIRQRYNQPCKVPHYRGIKLHRHKITIQTIFRKKVNISQKWVQRFCIEYYKEPAERTCTALQLSTLNMNEAVEVGNVTGNNYYGISEDADPIND